MEKIKNTIIIIGRDNSNTLGLVRQIGPFCDNLHVVLWDSIRKPLSCVIHSKYCKSYHWEPFLDGAMDYIECNFKQKGQAIIIPSGDLPAEEIDKRHNNLNPYFIIPGTNEQGLLTKVLDKTYMCKIAEECGFSVPQSGSIIGKTIDLENFTYPCLVKPTKHGFQSRSNFKTKVCQNKEELIQLVSQLDDNQVYQVQEYIKKDSEVLIYGYRTEGGKCKTFGILHRIRGGEDFDTTYGYIDNDIPKYINYNHIDKFLNKISYTGLFSFEYGISGDKAYFFEVNLRNDATAYWYYLAGVNVPLLWIRESLQLSVEEIPQFIEKRQYFIDEIFDLLYVSNGSITMKQHRSDLKRASLFKYKDANDLQPYIRKKLEYKLRSIYKSIKTLFKK